MTDPQAKGARRKLQALRNLAERPGTEAEGALAREMLARLEEKRSEGHQDKPEWERPLWRAFEDYRRADISTDDFIESMCRRIQWERDQPLPRKWVCACAARVPAGSICENTAGHAAIQQQIRERFKPGDRVYYNHWSYEANSPGVVRAYIRPKWRPNGDHPWAWISVKFDHLKNARQVPIYSRAGWHLSHKPLNEQERRALTEGVSFARVKSTQAKGARA